MKLEGAEGREKGYEERETDSGEIKGEGTCDKEWMWNKRGKQRK